MFFSVRQNPIFGNIISGMRAAAYLLWILHVGHDLNGSQPKVLIFTLFILFLAQSLAITQLHRQKYQFKILNFALISILPFLNSPLLFGAVVFLAGILTPILPLNRYQTLILGILLAALMTMPPPFILLAYGLTLLASEVKSKYQFGPHGFNAVFLPTAFVTWNWLSIRFYVDPSSHGSIQYASGLVLGAFLFVLPIPKRWKRLLLVPWLLAFCYMLIQLEGVIQPDFNLEIYTPVAPIVLGGLIGLSCVCILDDTLNRLTYLGMALGLLAVLLSSSSTNLIWILIAISVMRMIWSVQRFDLSMNLSLMIVLAAVYIPFSKIEENRSITRHYPSIQLTSKNDTISRFGLNGQFSFDIVEDEMSLFVNKADRLTISLDGSTISTNGRAASSERFFGSFAGLLSNQTEHIVISGDHVANVLTVLRKNKALKSSHINLIFPNSKLVKTLASKSPSTAAYWLGANTELIYNHRRAAVSHLNNVDLYLDIVHSPWGDSDSPYLNDSYFQKIKRSLNNDGLYGLLIHLRNWDEGFPQQRLASAANQFQYVQVCLPETGIDSVLFFGSDHAFSFEQFKGKHDNQLKAIVAASHCVGGRELLEQWSKDLEFKTPLTWKTPPRQLLHLTQLQGIFETPSNIWSTMTPSEEEEIRQYHRDKSTTLKIYESAAGGNIEDVFKTISQLRKEAQNPNAMWPLIKRHVLNAKSEIKKARKEGVISKHWKEAKRFALTAQMISPKSIEPQLLLGEIAIAESLLDNALKHFENAYEVDPLSLSAINGFTRVYGIKGDDKNVELWLNKAVEAYPRDGRSHLNLGVFLKNKNRYSEAEDHLQRAASIADGRIPNASMALTELYLDLKQPTRALVEIERQIRIQSSAFAWFLRGRSYFDLKQYDNAEKDFRRAILKDPNLHQARGEVGRVRIAKGDLEGAAQAFRATLQFDPSNKVAKQNLVQVEKEINARKALKVSPSP